VINNLAFLAHKIKDAVSPILIQGETGTGKGVLAHWFHDQGSRAQQPFVDLNCGSFSRELLESELFGHEKGAFTGAIQTKTGLLEIGDRGTVFLDEIGDVDLSIQPKLLKVLEEKQFRRLGSVCDKKVNIRLIAATHQDLRKLVREQRFRSDLFFRINTIALTMPALRERPEDIPLLSQLFLASLAEDMGGEEIELASSALRALQSYSWPGNVRELHNVLERAVLLKEGSTVTEADLHFEVDEDTDQLQPTLKNLERRYIRSVLAMEGGRVGAAARRLGMARSSLYHKLKQYRAEEPKARSDAASDTVMTSGFITPDPGDEFD
jgi:DNA-binding NtrC family response regulator